MIFKLLADVTLFIHFSWILFTIFGSLIARKYFWLKYIHLGMLSYGLLIEIFGWVCPLTYLENYFRRLHDPSTSYTGDFIPHYIDKIVYLNVSRFWLVCGAIIVVIFNLSIYFGNTLRGTIQKRSGN